MVIGIVLCKADPKIWLVKFGSMDTMLFDDVVV